jgi:hypothetical protein
MDCVGQLTAAITVCNLHVQWLAEKQMLVELVIDAMHRLNKGQ